jgi:hypothetical protein
MMLVAGYDAKQASKQLGRILNNPDRVRLKEIVGPPIRINDNGCATYATTGQYMHRVLLCLPPGRLSDDYMDECARVLWMRDTGDSRLIAEVEDNRAATSANGGVPRMESLFGSGQNVPENVEICGESRKHRLEQLDIDVKKQRISVLKSSVDGYQIARDFLEHIGQLDSRQDIDIGLAIKVQIRNTVTADFVVDKAPQSIGAGQSIGLHSAGSRSAVQDQAPSTLTSPGAVYDVTTSKIEAQRMKGELGWSTRFINDHERSIGTAISLAYKAKYKVKPQKHPQVDNCNETREVNHYTTKDRELFQAAIRAWYFAHIKGVDEKSVTCKVCGVNKRKSVDHGLIF